MFDLKATRGKPSVAAGLIGHASIGGHTTPAPTDLTEGIMLF
jgi:hypothetical protein